MGVLTLHSRDPAGELTRTQFLLQVLGLSLLVGDTPAVVEHRDRESGNSLDLELEAHWA